MKMRSALKTGLFFLTITLFACSSGVSQEVEPARLLFGADDGVRGMELWISNGTASGTTLVKDINPGPVGSGPGEMAVLKKQSIFSAYDRKRGRELWVTDGTAEGTTLVKDIRPGNNDSFPTSLTVVDGLVFFRANDGTNGLELWVTDGTVDGTRMVKDINPEGDAIPTDLTVLE